MGGLRMMGRRPTMWGNDILSVADQEIERLVNNSYLIAKKIINDNRELLEHLTEALMERETVTAEEFQMMLVEFKSQTIDYAVIAQERNREKLPFQGMPM